MTLSALGGYLLPRPESAPTIASPTPEPTPEPTTHPTLDAKSTTILELFNPSDQALTKQLTDTALSQQIEQILTTSFVLTRCKLITEENYRDNYRALTAYATTMRLAPDAAATAARLRQLAESASTSYAFVYRRVQCDDPSLPPIAEKLLAWQKPYLAQ